MNARPKLKLQLNMDLDIDIGSHFVELPKRGIDFGQDKVINLYPELSKVKEESTSDKRKMVIANFTKKYYSEHKIELENKNNIIGSDWESVAEGYFSGVDIIFNNRSWPKGDYICYLSIFDCNPRFLETKSFQVYQGLSDRTNYIIAHEMLHFIFFDYMDKEELDFKNSQDEHTIWLLSEWFNDLMLNLSAFKQFGENIVSAYPEVVEFSKQFNDKSKITDVKSFFEVIKPVISVQSTSNIV